MATPLSLVVTTLNNSQTLAKCLESVAWADEIVVLDSFSRDKTCDIARAHGARVIQHAFLGYAKQKQMAIDAATHDWVLLLDADEALSAEVGDEIRDLMAKTPSADGYTLPRIELLFWRWSSPRVRMNRYLRLFDRRLCGMNDVPIHAAPECRGRIRRLTHGFYHYGEPDIHTKVAKLNYYSSGLVEYKAAANRSLSPWWLVVYPPLAFVRSYIFKRNFVNGWAGFIGSVCMAFYAFLKYAKVYERFQTKEQSDRLITVEDPPADQSSNNTAGGDSRHRDSRTA